MGLARSLPLPFTKGEDEGNGLFENRRAPHLNPLPAIGERRTNRDRLLKPTLVEEHGASELAGERVAGQACRSTRDNESGHAF